MELNVEKEESPKGKRVKKEFQPRGIDLNIN